MNFHLTSLRLRAALISAAFVVFAAAASPAYGQATTTTTNEELPISGTIINTCNGDTVTYQGTVHVTNTVTTDASGGYHLKTHTNYQDVSGVGAPSLINYRIVTTTNVTVNDSDSAQFETTLIQTIKAVSQGSAPNLFLHFVMHVTVNANGETTSTVVNVNVDCNG